MSEKHTYFNCDYEEIFEYNSDCDIVELLFDDYEDDHHYDENNLTPTVFEQWWWESKTKANTSLKPPKQLPKEVPPVHFTSSFNKTFTWAHFADEEEDYMTIIGRVPVKRIKVIEFGTKKKCNYAFNFKSKTTNRLPVPQNKLCFSITKGVECPHYSCKYIHHYSHIESCKFEDECKYVSKVDERLYLSKDGKCNKRHLFESVESYLLRLSIEIKNCSFLVLRVSPQVHSDHKILETVLKSAQECKLKSLIWRKITL